MKLIASMFILIACLQSHLVAQWKIVAECDDVSKILFSIHDDNKLNIENGYYFPEYMPSDTLLTNGFRLKFHKNRKEIDNEHSYIWEYKFNSPIRCYLDSTFIYQRNYVQNINNYTIILIDKEGKEITNKFNVKCNGYQVPVFSVLNEWKINLNEYKKITADTIKKKHINVVKLIISCSNKEVAKNGKFVIGDLQIINKKVVERAFVNHLFEDLMEKPLFERTKYNSFSSIAGLPTFLSAFSYYEFYDYFTINKLKLIAEEDSTTELNALYDIVYHCIDNYPFYNSRNIDKENVLNEIEQFDNIRDSTLIDSLIRIVNIFEDPHFKLQKLKKETKIRKTRPIAAVYLSGEYYVGAVFDSSLQNIIYPGMKILSVNELPIEYVIEQQSSNYKGKMQVRRNKALSQLFYRQMDDSTKITVLGKKNDTIQETLYYNNKCIIPDNFRPKHLSFYNINQTTSFIKLNHWRVGDYIQFLNHFDVLQTKKNLIIDLRNNSGGDGVEVMRFASCFIKKPEIYLTSSYTYDMDTEVKETLMIKPNMAKNLSHLKIIFLINNRTACASEQFISFIKAKANAIIIGSEPTGGAYASVLPLIFPSGIQLAFNAMGKYYTPDNKIIEHKGIEPDIWVLLNEVQDLAPYKDKLLKTAIKISKY